jgi:hypothetical protein
MTNKMKLILVVVTIVSALFVVLSTPFAVDIADQVLSATASALGLHKTPALPTLALLIIPALYLAFRQRKRL